MIRRASLDTKINHERWLVSYADFITLLFAFFVVMYSVSQMSEAEYKQLSETLENAFSDSSAQGGELPQGTREGSQYAAALAELSQLQGELEEALEGLVEQSKVSLSGNEDWVEIDINANLIFASARADLSEEAITIFREIADIVAPYDNALAVSGHTDAVPIGNSLFKNNWELSSARAVSVVNLLAYSGVDPQRLSALAFGEYRPVADNTTEEGRASNRRVVLRIARERAAAPKQKVEELMPIKEKGNAVEPEVDLTDGEAEVEPVEKTGDDDNSAIPPIQLDNGGLLFTSDPDSPRNRR